MKISIRLVIAEKHGNDPLTGRVYVYQDYSESHPRSLYVHALRHNSIVLEEAIERSSCRLWCLAGA